MIIVFIAKRQSYIKEYLTRSRRERYSKRKIFVEYAIFE